MQHDTTTTRIRKFLIEHFPLTQQASDDDPLLESGLLDSMGVLEVLTFLEQEFDIIVSDEELLPKNFQSIIGITNFVQRKLTGAYTRQSE